MFSLELEHEPDGRDFLIAELWEQGCAGVTELDERHLRAFFNNDQQMADLQGRFPLSAVRQEDDRDWMEYVRSNWEPMLVGSRFFIVPEWRDDPAPSGRLRIKVNPGMAFGTGEHETTQLCLEALERHVKPGMQVLDVGTGSGILAVAAQLLGAGRVYGCDTDPVAVHIARQNAVDVPMFIGSADAIASQSMHLIVANITPGAIAGMASEFLRCLKLGGVLLASGFEIEDLDNVRASIPSNREAYRKRNWALLEHFL
jgi:ribosomal protein L11 methyltransferase